MRIFISAFLLFGVVVAPFPCCRADDRAREIVDRALRAHGGSPALAKTRLLKRTAEGTIYALNQGVPFKTELLIAPPDRFHDLIDVKGNKMIRVVNQDKGWSVAGGVTTDMTKSDLEDLLDEGYVLWLSTVLALTEDGFDLTALSDAKFAGRPADGVRVGRRGHGEVNLYFDPSSGRLAGITRRTRLANIDVTKEYRFADYKEMDGVQLATKIEEYLQGKKSYDLTVQKYEFPEKPDANAFSKP
jgi:hypothetical protein